MKLFRSNKFIHKLFKGVQDDGGTNFVYSGGYDVYPEITTQETVAIRLRGTIRLRLVRLR